MLTNELGALAGRIWRRKILVLLLTLLFTAASWYSTQDDATVYTSRAALTVMSENRAPEQDAILSQGYAAFFNDEVYQARLRELAGVPDDVTFEATTGLASPLLYVSATSTDPDHVATAAGAMASTLLDEVNAAIQKSRRQEVEDLRSEFEDLRTTTGPVPDQVIVDLHDRVGEIVADSSNKLQAVQLDSTVESMKPSKNLALALGFFSGLFVSCILAMLLGAVSRRLQSASEVERVTGAEVVAQLTTSPEPVADAHLWTILRQDGDAHHSTPLRGELEDGLEPATCFVVAVTCPRGNSNHGNDVARRLAIAASRSGRTVLMHMELDPVDGRLGFTDYVAGGVTRIGPVLHGISASLFELGRGTVSLDAYTALGDSRMSQLLDGLREDFDTIVIAAPSVLDDAEGPLACSLADEVVLVIDEGRSRTKDVVQGLHMLGLAVKVPVQLVMMNRRTGWRRKGRSGAAPKPAPVTTPAATPLTSPVVSALTSANSPSPMTATPAEVPRGRHFTADTVASPPDTTNGAKVGQPQSLHPVRERGLERVRRRAWVSKRAGTADAQVGAGDRQSLPNRSLAPPVRKV